MLFGGLPADLSTDRMGVIIRPSGAYEPSLFCSATKNRTDWHQISRATLGLILNTMFFLEISSRTGILNDLDVNNGEHWTAYAARFATFLPWPAHLGTCIALYLIYASIVTFKEPLKVRHSKKRHRRC